LALRGRLEASGPRCRRVVAFFDDDPRGWHKRYRGVPVVGMPECLLKPEWAERIDEIIIATTGADPTRLQALRQLLEPLPVKLSFDLG